jgi:hypothetical protein
MIMPNYWGANMDESVWSDPHEFKPERFLNEEGEVVKADKILSFGIGKGFLFFVCLPYFILSYLHIIVTCRPN